MLIVRFILKKSFSEEIETMNFFVSGKLKGLSALNLDGNPLDEPPAEIVKQGIKAIQQYLRNEGKTKEEDQRTDDDDEEPSIDMVADVWASSDDDGENQRRLTRSNHQNVLPRQSLTLSLQKSKYFH